MSEGESFSYAREENQTMSTLIERWRKRAATCLQERDKYAPSSADWQRLHAKARTWEQAAQELEDETRTSAKETNEWEPC
jgi:hypothetical protein